MATFIEETSNRLLPRVVLIACGSFSPITPMHLRMFEIARDYLTLNRICEVIGGIVSPTHDSYGKKDLAPAKHRCTMVKLALKSSKWIRLSEWETQQDTWSRTQTVLQHHQNFMNNQIQINNNENNGNNGDCLPEWIPSSLNERKDPVQLKLLCGADLLQSFAVPELWLDSDIEDIVSNHGLVVITRSGTNPEKFIFESNILFKHQRNINLVTNWVPNEVSSTMIRRLLCRGLSVKYLLDDLVADYIADKGLYQSNTKLFETLHQTNMLNLTHVNQRRRKNYLLNGNRVLDNIDNDNVQHNIPQTSKMSCCHDGGDKKRVWTSGDQKSPSNSFQTEEFVRENSDSQTFNDYTVQIDKIKHKKIKMA